MTPEDENDSAGKDSTVDEWFGQNVERDAALADELSEEFDNDEAERRFDEQAEGRDIEERRRGDSIDPDLGARTTDGPAGSTD